MKKLLSFFAFITFFHVATAQTQIRVHVSDGRTNQAIRNCTIVLSTQVKKATTDSLKQSKDSTVSSIYQTNDSGYFQDKVVQSGIYSLSAEAAGYKPNKLNNIHIIPSETLNFQITLEPIQMADKMRQDGRIYVLIAVMLTILAGITLYLFRLDKKISRIEMRS